MVDQKPPRLQGSERDTVLALLQYQRESFVRKVADVGEVAAREPVVASGTTLLWLVKHVAGAETTWVLSRFAGEDVGAVDDTVGPRDTMSVAIEDYRSTWARVDGVIAGARSLDEPCRRPDAVGSANLRWVLMHLLEETARHAGHADILRELIDGRTGR